MIEYFPQTIYYPKDEVERKWRTGELAQVETRLLEFIDRHAQILMDIAMDSIPEPSEATGEKPKVDDYLDAIRILIFNKGTIHPPAEMAEMIKEINKEIWYQGESGESNSQKVWSLWEQKYAYQWREARIFETFVVLEHIAPRAVSTLLESLKKAES